MNTLPLQITSLISTEHISYLQGACEGVSLGCLVIDTPLTSPQLCVGTLLTVGFKETEVTLFTSPPHTLGNLLPCVLKTWEKGDVMTHLILAFGVHTIHALVATPLLPPLTPECSLWASIPPHHFSILKD